MKKCPAEIAGNGISRPLNSKKKNLQEHAPFGGPCFLNVQYVAQYPDTSV